MSTDNKSPSYLEERQKVRRWLTTTPDGKMAREHLIKNAPGGDAANILDDDSWVRWDDIIKEYRGGVVHAANCREARESFTLAMQSGSVMGPPSLSKARWTPIFSPPEGYVIRRMVETGEPNYWNDPANVYREALENYQWAKAPADYLRGQLEKHLPKPRLVVNNTQGDAA